MRLSLLLPACLPACLPTCLSRNVLALEAPRSLLSSFFLSFFLFFFLFVWFDSHFDYYYQTPRASRCSVYCTTRHLARWSFSMNKFIRFIFIDWFYFSYFFWRFLCFPQEEATGDGRRACRWLGKYRTTAAAATTTKRKVSDCFEPEINYQLVLICFKDFFRCLRYARARVRCMIVPFLLNSCRPLKRGAAWHCNPDADVRIQLSFVAISQK